MEFCKGELVMCIAGREKDRLMCVAEFDGKYVYPELPVENEKIDFRYLQFAPSLHD